MGKLRARQRAGLECALFVGDVSASLIWTHIMEVKTVEKTFCPLFEAWGGHCSPISSRDLLSLSTY